MNKRGLRTTGATWLRRCQDGIGAAGSWLVTSGAALWRRYRGGIKAVAAGLVCGAFIGCCFAVLKFLGFVADLGAGYGNYGLGEMVQTVQVIGFDLLGLYAATYACIGAFCGFIGAAAYRAVVYWAGEADTAGRSTYTGSISVLTRTLIGGFVVGVFFGVAIGFFGTIATIPIPVITLTCNIGGYLAAVQVSRR
ncbi:hypothetical protein GWI34_04090 [Actinomadura sp. DSM 109109]|nr:hypothetical protein [Actinomadura lepetitiana]